MDRVNGWAEILSRFGDVEAGIRPFRDTLLGLFSAGSLPEAIVKAEGLDRAVVNDFVGIGSSREGQQVPIALRFRGRATVIGQVVLYKEFPKELRPSPVSIAVLGAALYVGVGDRVLVNPVPNPPGTFVEPARFADAEAALAHFVTALGSRYRFVDRLPAVRERRDLQQDAISRHQAASG